MADINGMVYAGRPDITPENRWLYWLSQNTNAEGRRGGVEEAFKGVDAVVAASKSGPDTIKKDWIKTMADDAILFACANRFLNWLGQKNGRTHSRHSPKRLPHPSNNSLAPSISAAY
jgi:malate dehydrogenase (oxaloacetate-decarboxylating)